MVSKRHSERNGQVVQVPQPQSPDRAGMFKEWGGSVNNPPPGWLVCDGSEVSRTTYADLFAAIGTRYGNGDGVNTFNLPYGPWRTHKFNMAFDSGPTGDVNIGDMVITRDRLGFYRTEFDFVANLDSLTTNPAFLVRGIVFDDRDNQAFAINQDNNNAFTMNRAILGLNTNSMTFVFSSSVSAISARVNASLKERPTDNVVSGDGRFGVLDDAWDSIPIIKAYSDTAGVSVSNAPATVDAPGSIQLNQSFAAQAGQYGLVRPARTQFFTIVSNIPNPTVNQDIFTFNNLTPFKKYFLQGQIGFASGPSAVLDLVPENSSEDVLWRVATSSDSPTSLVQFYPINVQLTPTQTTMTIKALDTTQGNITILGRLTGTSNRSYIRITEINDDLYEEVTDFT